MRTYLPTRAWLRSPLAAVATLALWIMIAPAADATPKAQQAPGSRVVLDLPDGYEPSTLFSGFTNEQTGASIIVVEMPEKAYADLETGMTPEALAPKGITSARRLKLDRPDPHIYMQAEQKSQAGVYSKFFVVIRQKGITALITANIPHSAISDGRIGAIEIESVLAGARIVDAAAPARDLFRLGELGPFKPAGERLGTARIFTLDGNSLPSDGAGSKPLLIVAPSLDRRPVADPEAHAEQLLLGLPGVTDVRIEERRRIAINGLDSVEIIAGARDRDGGVEVTIYHVLLVAPTGGYFRIVGQVPTVERAKLLPELKKIAASFVIAK